jgi:hypothetical protein
VEVLHAFHRGDQYVFEVESGRYRIDLKALKAAGSFRGSRTVSHESKM